MSDNHIREDEEYKYPEDEYVVEKQPHEDAQEEAAQTPPKEEPAWKIFARRNKRMLSVIGVAVVAIIAFQIMNYEKNNKVIQAKPVKATPVAPVKTKSSQQILAEKLGSLEQSGETNKATIVKVQEKLEDMQTQLDQANQTNQQVKQAMVLLLGELKRVNNHLANEHRVKKPSGPPKPEVVYHIRALIDNRAWIVGSNGLTDSVTVGDPVPNYGTVKKIDSVRGVLETSSGKLIKLGNNDY